MLLRRLLAIAIAALAIGLSGSRVCALDSDAVARWTGAPGPHKTSVALETWTDAARSREIPVKIYFPADGVGPWPVIVFSHGLGGSRDGYAYLGEHWASCGYVSVHLQHEGSDDSLWRGKGGLAAAMQGMRSGINAQTATDRMGDVHFAVQQLHKMNAAPGPWAGKFDLAELGMAGHSYGAWTTLTAAGEKVSGGRSFAEPEFKAAIAMSSNASLIPGAAATAYSDIKIPILHMTGTEDQLPLPGNKPVDRRAAFDGISDANGADQYLVTFEGGDHMVFSGRTRLLPARARRDERFHALTLASTTAFWDAYLKGDAAAKAWLSGGGFARTMAADGKLEIKIGQDKAR